ncbi:MAG: PEP-CTERM sorting domain-containing protein [Methylacidiphilales bacterium]|nr:PEP-CTERM sorting domain-containing protein [Candidatus Methylacidiphilales bacterium]NJR15309.1 PEP-CTERM sorting domain-containing protein [Calothrix sp. CSU_2_0]
MNRQFFQLASTGFSVVSTIAAFQLAQLPAYAVDFVNQRDALGENDRIDWESLGSANPFKQLPNSFSAKSEKNRSLSVSIPSFFGSPQPLVFTTQPTSSIETNFPTGQSILFTGFSNVPFPPATNTALLSVKFDQPVKAAGTQLALETTQKPDDALTGRGLPQGIVSAFDSENNLLGTFSTTVLDNSPVFLGISSDTANISRLVLRTSEANVPFGINALSFVTIPEPNSTFALLAIALGGGLIFKQKQKRKF